MRTTPSPDTEPARLCIARAAVDPIPGDVRRARARIPLPVTRILCRVCLVIVGLTGCGDGPTSRSAPEPPARPTSAEPDFDDDLERLRALGYVEVGEPLASGAATGVVRHDPDRAANGVTLVIHSAFCRTELIDMDGDAFHSWSDSPCKSWGNTVLTPEGDLLVSGAQVPHAETREGARGARSLERLAWDGTVRWRTQIPSHHDVELAPDGRVLTLTYAHRVIPSSHETLPTRDHGIAVLSGAGELQEELFLYDLLQASDVLDLERRKPRPHDGELEVDLLHTNSIEWVRPPGLVEPDRLYAPTNVLVCIRNQDTLAILDWERQELLWAWGQGELMAPHDATLLENGNILAFDNGLGRDWSRVVEVDPRTDEIVWQYRAPEPSDFFTPNRGACQRLSNGNTLITESSEGRVFEVTPSGDIVWDYRNPNLTEQREPSVIVRARRFEGLTPDQFVALVESGDGTVPRVD